jgi:hypothetical protein
MTLRNDVFLPGSSAFQSFGVLDVANITVVGQQHSAIIVSTGGVLRNVLIADTASVAVQVWGAEEETELGYSAWWNNFADYSGELDETHLFEDPLLFGVSDDGDCYNDTWWPYASSPVIGRGDPAIVNPDGSRSDIGASGGPDAAGFLYADGDEDGFVFSKDCDDTRSDVSPVALELCATVGVDDDCDGVADEADADDVVAWYPDADEDRYGDAEHPGELTCMPAEGWTTDHSDCDDSNPALSPETVWYFDGDEDGFGDDTLTAVSCEPPEDHVAVGGDCHPELVDARPGGVERCATVGVDDDCVDGPDDPGAVDALRWWPDEDGDGRGDALAEFRRGCVAPEEGWVSNRDDCNDAEPTAWTGAPEVPGDGIDNNCDGSELCYADVDGDGYGAARVVPSADLLCLTVDGEAATDDGDCNDWAPEVHPEAEELAGDGVDGNCDGEELCFHDGDSDGWGDAPRISEDMYCDGPGEAAKGGDCEDGDGAIHPEAPEVPGDGEDTDCDEVDDCYVDSDEDGFGGELVEPGTDLDCSGAFESKRTGDCEDELPLVFPGAEDLPADGVDGDCNTYEWCYVDDDGDTHGSPALIEVADLLCASLGVAQLPDDCNDDEPLAWDGAIELRADGVDNDCDGYESCFDDLDDDGHGGDGHALSEDLDCDDDGEAPIHDDCNDDEPLAWTDATEVCDGVDNDCDGDTDPSTAEGAQPWYLDDDEDGYGDTDQSTLACDPPDGYVDNDEDCNDDEALAWTGADEVCDGVDNDCDGDTDPTAEQGDGAGDCGGEAPEGGQQDPRPGQARAPSGRSCNSAAFSPLSWWPVAALLFRRSAER